MTTYYGVWSGKGTWWYDKNKERLFYTPVPELAKAQAVFANSMSEEAVTGLHWEARAIGEDGLPVTRQQWQRPRLCAMCGEPATEYVDVHVKGWMCAEHKVVKLGCVPKTGTLAFLDEYVFDTKVGYWAKELMP